eukprot:2173255-Pleurochrysis_carterae.AAC.1
MRTAQISSQINIYFFKHILTNIDVFNNSCSLRAELLGLYPESTKVAYPMNRQSTLDVGCNAVPLSFVPSREDCNFVEKIYSADGKATYFGKATSRRRITK